MKDSSLYSFKVFRPNQDDCELGTIEWSEAVSRRLQLETQAMTAASVYRVRDQIELIFSSVPRPWENWPEDHPFQTPDDYCRAVTGYDWETLLSVVTDLTKEKEFKKITIESIRAELAKTQVVYRSQGTRTDLHGYNVTKLRGENSAGGGNSAPYLLRRLARDEKYKIIFDAYERGEFKSVRAAAKEAGLIKEKTAFEQIIKLLPKLTSNERHQLKKLLDTN